MVMKPQVNRTHIWILYEYTDDTVKFDYFKLDWRIKVKIIKEIK